MMMTALDCNRRLGIDFAAVHDSYWTHAGDIDAMNASLREQFVNMYKRPLLERLHQSLKVRFPSLPIRDLPDRGNFNIDEVKASTYFFS